MTKKIKKFSKEDDTLKVMREEDKSVKVGRDAISNKQGNNIIIGTLNVVTAPIKNRYEKHYKESIFHLVADIILVLAVIVMALSIYIIRNMDLTSGINLEISTTDERVLSVATETFEFYYSNNTRDKIEDVSLAIKLPENFVIEEVSPKNLYDYHKNTFSLGAMENGANGTVKVSGVVFSTVGNQQLVSSSFNYTQNGNKRNVLRSLHYAVDDSLLDISINLPQEVFAGAVFQGSAIIRNNSLVNLDNINLSINSQGLKFVNIECGDCVKRDNSLLLEQLAAGEEQSVVFEVKAQEVGVKKVSFDLALQRGTNLLLQESETLIIATRKPKLKIQALSDKQQVASSDQLNYKIVATNKEIESIENLEVKILSNNNNFRINKLDLVGESDVTLKGNILKIGKLAVGESRKISLDVSFVKNTKALEQNFGIIFDASYNLGANMASFRTYSPVAKVLSEVWVSSGGYYYSRQGDQLGVGPVPPVVGIPTTYWVFWNIDNYGNDLDNFRITAKLPSGVVFTGNQSLLAGSLHYKESNGELEWDIPQVSREGGVTRVGFEISQTPNAQDVGKVLDLLTDIKYFYSDNYCGTPRTGELMKINTRLIRDKNILTDGIVQAIDL